ncbi:MAG: tolR protein [Bdellovibrionales bacterium CG10_big_fil_rev_8_21_14_0_10_45_34]|nr:MAG: tolR protein [Bdellovibrionales bacterium CG10_big_fil_rev_8_21_14_0_10_45_34]
MASIGGDSNDKNDINVDLNLVPFIDLMSVCIIFLLITAVWTQVSMIQLGTSIYGKQNDTGQVDPPPRPDLLLTLRMDASGYSLRVGNQIVGFPLKEGLFDHESLVVYLKQVKEKYPEKSDSILSVADNLTYEDMIRGMDTLLKAGFPEVSVATAEVN